MTVLQDYKESNSLPMVVYDSLCRDCVYNNNTFECVSSVSTDAIKLKRKCGHSAYQYISYYAFSNCCSHLAGFKPRLPVSRILVTSPADNVLLLDHYTMNANLKLTRNDIISV